MQTKCYFSSLKVICTAEQLLGQLCRGTLVSCGEGCLGLKGATSCHGTQHILSFNQTGVDMQLPVPVWLPACKDLLAASQSRLWCCWGTINKSVLEFPFLLGPPGLWISHISRAAGYHLIGKKIGLVSACERFRSGYLRTSFKRDFSLILKISSSSWLLLAAKGFEAV